MFSRKINDCGYRFRSLFQPKKRFRFNNTKLIFEILQKHDAKNEEKKRNQFQLKLERYFLAKLFYTCTLKVSERKEKPQNSGAI